MSISVTTKCMCTHCLFCAAPLGANEAIANWPLGRRLAFDAARGRLWVVCEQCERWNLSPLEERWEAIEECERAFCATPLRASTDNIGLARLREGLELVRIGATLRPEIAAWRYGRHLRRRFFRAAGSWTMHAMGAGGIAGAMLAGALAPQVAVAGIVFGLPLVHVLRRTTVVDRIYGHAGFRYSVRRADISEARVVVEEGDQGWAVVFPHRYGMTRVEGRAARVTLGRLLVHLNNRGASAHSVSMALARLESARDAGDFIVSTARRADLALAREREAERRRDWWRTTHEDAEPATLGDLDFYYRIALEMALHEDFERRVLEGELRLLEEAWRDAERVAAIADDLLTPEWIKEYLSESPGRARMRDVEGPPRFSNCRPEG